ncbi:MAG: hypothetical protein AAB512_04285 [Patescibacteria group bacterium]
MIETQTDKPSVTFTIPSWILAIGKFVDYAAKTASLGTKAAVEGIRGAGQSDREGTDETKPVEDKATPPRKFNFHFKKVNFNFLKKLRLEKIKGIKAPFKKHPKIAIAVLVFILAVVFATFKIAKPSQSVSNSIDSITSGINSLAKVNVNRKFEVPIKNKDGSETGEKLGITITTIEKTNEILIKNSPAKTKNGKIFLVLNIEIQNDTKKQLTVRPVDMVRLIGDDGRSYAPDVHNNEVSAEPVSLRKTRVGYVVDGSKNSFKLLVGEVRGQQEPIEVSF